MLLFWVLHFPLGLATIRLTFGTTKPMALCRWALTVFRKVMPSSLVVAYPTCAQADIRFPAPLREALRLFVSSTRRLIMLSPSMVLITLNAENKAFRTLPMALH